MADIDVTYIEQISSSDELYLLGVDKNGKCVNVPIELINNEITQQRPQLTYKESDGQMQIVSNIRLDCDTPIFLERRMKSNSGTYRDIEGTRHYKTVIGYRRYNPETCKNQLQSLRLYGDYTDFGNYAYPRYVYYVEAKFKDGYTTSYATDFVERFLGINDTFYSGSFNVDSPEEWPSFQLKNGTHPGYIYLEPGHLYDSTRFVWAFSYKSVRCPFYVTFNIWTKDKEPNENGNFYYDTSIATRPFC